MNKRMRMIQGILMVALGNLLYAYGLIAFVRPTGLIAGGTT